MAQKFQLINSTRKQNPKNIRERVGFLVSVFAVQSGHKSEHTLNPGRSVLTEELEESHLRLQKSGALEIRPVKDVSLLLKQHANKPAPNANQVNSDGSVTRGTEKKKNTRSSKKGKAMSMGEASAASQKDFKASKKNDEGAVNPDGKDNFTVVAPNLSTRPESEGFTVTAPSRENRE